MLEPDLAPLRDGRTLGIPGNASLPDLVPVVATNGRDGWVDRRLTLDQSDPELTADGTRQAAVPVYDGSGVTQIGVADVSQPYRE